MQGLPLLHEDADCLVIDKPTGLLSVPGRGANLQDCAWLRLRAAFPEALVVHRLDMSTSGLLLFARHATAQRALSRAFEQREVGKRYIAVVQGCVDRDEGEIDLPMKPDWPRRPRQQIDPVQGKPAFTRFRVVDIDRPSDSSRLALEPVTGRTHQLRVHLTAIGHPILGDALYAPPEVLARAQRLMLHATSLRFRSPGNGEVQQVDSPAPF